MKIQFYLILVFVSLMVSADDFPEVKNGERPQGQAYTLKFTEDLRFGGEDLGEEYLWPGLLVQVEANGAGHMFVSDPIGKRILEYDQYGKFVKLVGKPGEGPGEFQNIASFQILDDGAGIAASVSGPVSSLSYFNPDMTFKDRTRNQDFSAIVQGIRFAPNGKTSAVSFLKLDFSQPFMVTSYKYLKEDKTVLQELGEVKTMSFNPQRMNDPAFWTEFMASQFQPYAKGDTLFWAFDTKNNLYSARSGSYEITRWDPAGKKTLVFGRKHVPVKWTEEDIKELIYPIQEALTSSLPPQLQEIVSDTVISNAIQKAELPSVQHPVQGLTVMEDGTLLNMHKTSLTSRQTTVDIFDPQGKYLGEYSHKNLGLNRIVFKNGYAYTMETDAEEQNSFVRYKVSLVPVK